MYKRPREAAQPKKKKDERRRKRNVIVNFRMSPEERAELEQRIMVSGKSKQDYMIQSSLEHKIEVIANRKMIVNIQNRMDVIEAELKRVTSVDALDMEKLAGLEMTVLCVKSMVRLFFIEKKEIWW